MPNPRFRVRILNSQAESIAPDMRLGLGRHLIGSSPDCAIQLPYEGVEPQHASLTIEPDKVILENLGGSSDTFLGDSRISGKLPLDLMELATSQGLIGIAGTIWLQLITETGTTALGPSPVVREEFELPERYINAELIGEGGQGRVYRAHDTVLDMAVALKILVDPGNDEDRRLLKREVKKSLGLTHENIVRVHDFIESPPSIAMELVDGEDLDSRKRKKSGHLFAWEDIEPYILDLCSALSYAHKKGIVHRDIKPQNIFWTKEEVIKLGDFGIAIALADLSGQTDKEAGEMKTFGFCSPQQAAGEPVSKSDDIYSLGATLYDLLTGTPPFFRGYLPKQIEDKIPELMTVRLEMLRREAIENEAPLPPIHPIPQWLEQLVAQCLSKQEKDRPRSISDISRLIESKDERNGKPVRWPWAAAACAAIAGLWFLLLSPQIPAAPQINAQPKDINATLGQRGAFAVTVSGGSWQYQWHHNGAMLAGATNATLKVPNIQVTNAGLYRVVVSSSHGSTNSRAARLSVKVPPPPTITAHPQSKTIPVDQPVTFKVFAKGRNLSFQWTKDELSLPSTGSTLHIPKVQSNDSGTYQAVIRNPHGTVKSNPVSLTIILPLTITQQPEDWPAKEGEKAKFEVEVKGNGQIQFAWRLNGKDIPGETNRVYRIKSVRPMDFDSDYNVVIWNEAGKVQSKVAKLKRIIIPVPDVPLTEQKLAEVKRRSENDDVKAQWELHRRYYLGTDDVDQDFIKSHSWLKKQLLLVVQQHTKTNSIMAQFELGSRCFEERGGIKRNYKEAHKNLLLPAEKDDPEAQFMLGEIKRQGLDGIPKSFMDAFGWYQKAAAMGHAKAEFALAEMYEHGEGTEKNSNKALEFYKKAAEHAIGEAQFKMGQLYDLGIPIPDPVKAFDWYRTAATNKVVEAQLEVGRRYETGNGVGENSQEAANWYEKAMDQGNAMAEYRLGKLYRLGNGVKQNTATAIDLISRAATKDLFVAQLELGKIFKSLKRTKEAENWLVKASRQQPNSEATLYLASLYLTGANGEPNPGKAKQVFERIMNERSQHAQAANYLLGMMHMKGLFGKGSRHLAVEYFKKGASLKLAGGSYGAFSSYMLGILFKEGNLIYDGMGIKEEKRGQRPHQKELSIKYFKEALITINADAGNGFSLAQLHMAFASYTEYLPDKNVFARDIAQCYKWLILATESGLPRETWGQIDWQFTEQNKEAGLGLAKDFSQGEVAPKHHQDINIVSKTKFFVWWTGHLTKRREFARDLVDGVLAVGYISPNP